MGSNYFNHRTSFAARTLPGLLDEGLFCLYYKKVMLSYIDLKPGTKFVLNGEPYVVLEYSFAKKQRQKPTVQTKIKNLITASVTERSFTQNDKIEEADIDTRDIRFLYSRNAEYWFCEADNQQERFNLEEDIVGKKGRFLKENSIVKAQVFDGKIIGIEVPIKVDLKVTEAPPAVRGNTAQGVTKTVVLETGTGINAPIFINEGDVLRVNTEKGEYVERVYKS
ncbi:MAG: elongation factor P [Candidatus Tagabacteria bacterium CG09_land_8_20_14_0_10_41_14]|uniref:Elongation factor P n=2 Tax=Candidatus Tagaibacteriota TaxID=1817918 RepID=A0A2H0WLZ5_9BACT|nr:MAG: elongation factor P [Candidatus Tagabacteria bacterium CG09_land_8_20_14_0_10_41_14]PJE72900.1 MAG: elongation factor P [Candidatus Tagabacteria bacterium CG10_big_fil_rev_8_21_14_0_10_40_13]